MPDFIAATTQVGLDKNGPLNIREILTFFTNVLIDQENADKTTILVFILRFSRQGNGHSVFRAEGIQ